MKFNFSVDDYKLRKDLDAIESRIQSRGRALMDEIAELAKLKAQLYAPNDSGKLRSFIIKTVKPNTKGYLEVQVGYADGGFGVGNPHPEKYWKGGEFSLPVWMHSGSAKAKAHPWKSGRRPEFLFDARDDVAKVFKRKAVAMIRDVTNKK